MEADGAEEAGGAEVVAVVSEPRFAQRCREFLERRGLLARQFRAERLPDGSVALPVLGDGLPERLLRELGREAPGCACALTRLRDPRPSKRAQACAPARRLREQVRRWAEGRGVAWSATLEADLPRSWRRHGDLLLLGEDCFLAAPWKGLEPELWRTVAAALGAQRLAKRGRVLPDGARSPSVTLLLGEHGWVEHVDNGIRYRFDVTRCMFSFGNIPEKLRVASLPCAGEVLVDLYAGIGYFTLPFLVHAGAAFAHACEWNPHAVEALRTNLEINGVADRCQVHFGDNRQLRLAGVADRVNLGLIPSSEEGWPVACQVLRRDAGGILHIHQNVESFSGKTLQIAHDPEHAGHAEGTASSSATKLEWLRWAESVQTRIASLLQQAHGIRWETHILGIHEVKSYAPHVDHVVLDLQCRPCPLAD